MPSSWQSYQTDLFTYGGLAFMPFCRPPSRYTWSVHMLLQCYVLLIQVCNIAKGQRYSSKLNEHQVRNILRLACVRPAEREERTLGVNTITNPTCDCTFYFLFHMFFLIHTISFVFKRYKHLLCILRYSRRTTIPLMIMQKNLASRWTTNLLWLMLVCFRHQR